MSTKTKQSSLAIALANAPALLNWYKLFKAGTEQFVASEMGGQMLNTAAFHIHSIHTWEVWPILERYLTGG